MPGLPHLSDLPGPPRPMRRKGLVGQLVELPASSAPFDRLVETLGVKDLEPGAESSKLVRWELRDSLLDSADGGHDARAGLWAYTNGGSRPTMLQRVPAIRELTP